MRSLNESEKIAKAIMKQAIKGLDVIQVDTGEIPSQYDFDLILDGKNFAALEVTQSANKNRKHLNAVIRNQINLPARLIKRKWMLYIADEFVKLKTKERNKLIEKYDGYLAEIERQGIHRFFLDDAVNHDCIYYICKDLYVEAGFSYETSGSKICLADSGGVGLVIWNTLKIK